MNKSVSKRGYKPKSKFSIELLEKNGFGELQKWLSQISRFNKIMDYLYISDYKDKMLMLEIFTKEYKYSISARIQRPEKKGYLGCIVTTRKPRAGEDWNRGRDLANGSYSATTWEEIKNDIISSEIVRVVRKSPDREE
jgi:hypothetical protein